MKSLCFLGIVFIGTFLITNVHGLRSRKLSSSKSLKQNTKDATYPGQYPGGYPGAQGGVPSAPGYPYPDPSFFDDSDSGGCCGGGKKKHAQPYGYIPTGPVSSFPPARPTGNAPSTGPVSTNVVGFAQEFGTKGGQGGDVVQVNSLDDLIQYVGDDSPRILMINSNIEANGLAKVEMGSFKTIMGANGKITLYNIYLRATSSSQNIIFQNLVFKHAVGNKGNDDIQLYLNYGRAYWIDSCDFVGHDWSPGDGSDDKLLYIGGQATGATISNCFFGNHRYGLIFGYPNDNVMAATDDDTRVTICNNRFENLADRAPGLFRFGHYHVYNNYINNYGLGFTVATRGEVISEYNYFGSSPNKNAMLDDKGNGEFIDTGSVPPIANVESPKPDWSPSYNYNLKTTADPAVLDTTQKYVVKRIMPPRYPPPLVPPPMQFMSGSGSFSRLPGH